jgi:hypothetical protein
MHPVRSELYLQRFVDNKLKLDAFQHLSHMDMALTDVEDFYKNPHARRISRGSDADLLHDMKLRIESILATL